MNILDLEVDETANIAPDFSHVENRSHGGVVLASNAGYDGKVVDELLSCCSHSVLGDDFHNLDVEVGDVLHLSVGVVDSVRTQKDRYWEISVALVAISEFVDGIAVAN